VEVPAIASGVLSAINADVGAVAQVGAVIAVLSDGKATNQSAIAPVATAVPKPAGRMVRPPPPPPMPAEVQMRRAELDPFREVQTPLRNFGPAKLASGVAVTPLARRLATNAGIDLSRVAGSGPRGRITGRDVETAVKTRPPVSPSLARAKALDEIIGDVHRSRPHKVVPVDGTRRAMAARLAAARATVPQVRLSVRVDIDRVTSLRDEINRSAPKRADGPPAYELSINDFLVKALALALQAVPRANAIWSGEGVLEFEHSDIAIATPSPNGELAPVIVGAERKSVSAISNEVKTLTARLGEGVLQPQQHQGGTTTFVGFDEGGVTEVLVPVNPPQATTLAIGAVERYPVETATGGLAFAGRVTVTLSCDQRIVDRSLGAELLVAFRRFAESPLSMIA
jgi:pyruvate dehydrogenase E2 component (dihydrolipoamide acetyltransferase)